MKKHFRVIALVSIWFIFIFLEDKVILKTTEHFKSVAYGIEENKNGHKLIEDSIKHGEESEINIFIIVCVSKGSNKFGEENDRQPGQVNTLLKTLFLLTDTPVNVYILNNDEKLFNDTVDDVKAWGVETEHILRLKSVLISYPTGLEEMLTMFRICATARLFIDRMFPDLDAGIFLDTDIVLMDNIRNLWSYFSKFNSAQVMGMAATENIYSTVEYVPYYGPPGVGLNAGVILMNLTRMREMSGGGFIGSVRWVFGKHKHQLQLADQDILNAIFGYSPWYLYELPCTWNYIIWQCRIDFWSKKENPRTWLGKNQCLAAERDGVSLIHGNSSSFYVVFEEIFKLIFEFWLNFNISKDKLSDCGALLREKIVQAKELTVNQKGKEDISPCSKVPGIGDIMIRRLESVITEIHVK